MKAQVIPLSFARRRRDLEPHRRCCDRCGKVYTPTPHALAVEERFGRERVLAVCSPYCADRIGRFGGAAGRRKALATRRRKRSP
jgi:hypothetical protein